MELDLDTRFQRHVARLSSRVDELSATLMARARVEIPEWLVERPELYESIRTLTRESIRVELVAMAEGARLPGACPAVDSEWARLAAHVGGPISALVDGYRRGHQVQWEGWFDLIEDAEDDPAARRALLERGWRFFFAYAGRVGQLVAEEYTRERDRMLGSREQRRMHLVRELLDGRDVDAVALDYELDAHHVAVVAWGPEAADAVRALAHGLDRRLLVVGVMEETWWAWMGGDRPLPAPAAQSLREHRPPSGVRLAVGPEAQGAAGFRASHDLALSARRAAERSRAPVTHYEDVALEALATADEESARDFAARELRGVEADDLRSRRLRETLRAYFACGQNAATTAARLGVHEQTVAQRLRAVEERIGRPVATRRAELELALRLRSYMAIEFSP